MGTRHSPRTLKGQMGVEAGLDLFARQEIKPVC